MDVGNAPTTPEHLGDTETLGGVDSLMKNLRARRRQRSMNEKRDLSTARPETTSMENIVKKRVESRRLRRENMDNMASQPPSELMQRSQQPKTTRFDDTVLSTKSRGEKDEGDHASVLMSSRWKKLSMNVVDIVKQTSGREGYNFFTSTLTGSDNIAVPDASESPTGSFIENANENMKDELEQDPTEKQRSLAENSDPAFTHPVYIPLEDRLKAEATVYFRPNHSQETPSDVQVTEARAVEEGLFVGTTPQVMPSRIWALNHRMSHRTDKGLEWFEENGHLRRERNPLKLLQRRPFVQHRNDEYIELVEAETSEGTMASQSLGGSSQLQIEIGSIQFVHHPLFSSEHVISTRVEQAFQSYRSQDEKAAEYYDKKLCGLKNKLNSLKDSLTEIDPSSFDAIKVRSDIIEYLKQIKDIRQKKRRLLEVHYSLLKSLLRHWRDLKALRENQGYSNTTTFLTFKKIDTNADEEMAQISSDINAELTDMAELHSFEREQLTTISGHDLITDDTTLPESGTSLIFERETAEDDLRSYYSEHVRPPGEPQMIPVLANSNPISQCIQTSEDLRRADVARTQVFIKIYLNDMEVAQTRKTKFNQHFSVQFDETFIVELLHLPESVKLEILESSHVTSQSLAQVFLPIPEAQKPANNVSWSEQFEFSSSTTTVYNHSAVGSGLAQEFLPDNAVLLTTGCVYATLLWENHERDCGDVFMSQHADRVKVWTRTGVADSENVKKWIVQSRVDPNDPRNLDFFELVENAPSSCTEDAFRILELEDIQRFAPDDLFKYDRRFTLLKLRDEGHYRLSGKSIPLYSSEIPTSMWTEVIKSGTSAENELPLLSLGDFYCERQAAQNKFLLDIREKVTQISSQRRDLVLSDIVVSDFIPNISSLQATLAELIAPRRPLKPRRQVRKEVAHTSVVSTASIVVRVVRAYNVPLRMPSTSGPHPDYFSAQHDQAHNMIEASIRSATIGAQNQGLVSPFVEVAFEDKVLRTTTSSGANPSWNEDLSVSYEFLEKNFSASNPDRTTRTLYIRLFDEILVDILEDDRERATTIHQRIQKQFIGSLQLPFSTLRQRQKIEGTFQLEVPSILLGYSMQGMQRTGSENLSGKQKDSPKCQLQLFISLDPPFTVSSPVNNVLQSEEDHRHLEFTNQKLKALQVRYPSRNIFAIAMDTSGSLVFLSRYIHPQNPPLEVLQDATDLAQKMEFVAQFVSLIPFFSESLCLTREYNVWITSDHFLQLLGGDVEQHAVLLCNYFLYCGIQAWLILGHAIPEGKTAYVLTPSPIPEEVGYWIWNSSKGVHYYQNEPGIPLISIGCIVNGSNIWANVQEHDHPSLVVLELSNNKLWTPLLPSDVDWTSVQQDLAYTQTDSYKVKEIQQRFERSARDFIMKGRNRFVTKWNRHCTKGLQAILPSLENHSLAASLGEHYQALNEVRSSYDLSGFPMNFRYSDADHLLEAIERTGIHLSENKNAEFGLGVHIHAYPNDILSLWVYMVCMIPK